MDRYSSKKSIIMHIYQKLKTIANRLNYAFKNDIKPNFGSEYSNGFEHALKLFSIAFSREFKGHVQIQSNLHQVIRELKAAQEKLERQIDNKKRYIYHLENERAQNSVIRLSNSKRKKIIRAIAEMTGQPYEYIRDQFNGLIEVKGVNND